MKRIISMVVVVLMLVTLFAGCSNSQQPKGDKSTNGETSQGTDQAATGEKVESISLMYQGLEFEQEIIKETTEKFTAQTGIEVELIYAPHDTYQEQLSGTIVAKNIPDIFMLDGPFLPNLVWSGVSAEINDYIDKDVLEDMTASNIAQCTYPIDGNLYAVSPTDSTVILYGNRTYLEKIGARIPTSVDDAWTIEEFEGYLEALSKLDEVKFPLDIMRAYGVKSEWGTYGFYSALISAGGGIIDRETWQAEGILNGKETVETLQRFQNWSNNGWIVPENAGENMLYNETRDAAIAWCGTWFYPAAYEAMGDELVILPLPDFGNGVKSPNATWIYSISNASSEAEKVAAGELLSFMLKDEDFLKIYEVEGAMYPALKSWAANYPTYTDPNKLKIAAEQADTAVVRPPHPAYPVITSSFMKAFGDILDGGDIQSILDKAAKEIDEDIEDNDGYPPFGE